MFIGHFAVAFAAKRAAPAVSLGTLFLAAQFLDILWPAFVIAGIERVQIAPGDTAFTPLHFAHYPYSHSLVAAALWAVLFGAAYRVLTRDRTGALVTAALVLSHWVLDAVSHRPDLPLLPGGQTMIGLGLWHSVWATLSVECGLFAAGLAVFVAQTRARATAGWVNLWALVAVLMLAYAGAAFGPLPPNVEAVAYSGLLGWLIVGWAYLIDRQRVPRGATTGVMAQR